MQPIYHEIDSLFGRAECTWVQNGHNHNVDFPRGSAMSFSSGNAPVYRVNPTFNLKLEASLPLTIASDSSRLADYVDFQETSFIQSFTLLALSGQLSADD